MFNESKTYRVFRFTFEGQLEQLEVHHEPWHNKAKTINYEGIKYISKEQPGDLQSVNILIQMNGKTL